MRKDAVTLEEQRLKGIGSLEEYPWFHERHRIFPAVFEDRKHSKILDLSAGVGCVAQRIHERYPAEIICNEISPTCLTLLRQLGLKTVSFDLDDPESAFPFPNGYFDALVSLVTIEHLLHFEHFLLEARRILRPGGYLYLSTPNYAALEYLLRMLLSGKTFHDLQSSPEDRYEFLAHVRYFTYRTLLEYVTALGFLAETVYIALPKDSSRFRALRKSCQPLSVAYRYAMWIRHHLLSPRWAAEPILCLKNEEVRRKAKPRKVIL